MYFLSGSLYFSLWCKMKKIWHDTFSFCEGPTDIFILTTMMPGVGGAKKYRNRSNLAICWKTILFFSEYYSHWLLASFHVNSIKSDSPPRALAIPTIPVILGFTGLVNWTNIHNKTFQTLFTTQVPIQMNIILAFFPPKKQKTKRT